MLTAPFKAVARLRHMLMPRTSYTQGAYTTLLP